MSRSEQQKPASDHIALRRGFPHDMGGGTDYKHYDFSAAHDENEVFAEEWHGRALAVTIAAAAFGKWNLDASRHARETLPPQDYKRFSYYEKWLSGLANLLAEHQLVTPSELRAGRAEQQTPPHPKAFTAQTVTQMLCSGAPTERKHTGKPLFEPGCQVITRTPEQTAIQKGGHTRLPAYASHKKGVITACHGAHILPDSHAHFKGEAAEPLYTVCFKAADLFADADSRDEICLDLWQSYLSPCS